MDALLGFAALPQNLCAFLNLSIVASQVRIQ